MSNKHFRPQHAPRPTKGQLVSAAKQQVKTDEAKAATPLPPVDETKLPEPATLAEAVADYQQAKEEFKETRANDAAAGAGQNEPQPAPATPVAESPAPVVAAPAAPIPAPAAAPKVPKGSDPAGLYALGKRYSPKTDRNSETWGKICKALAEGPKTMKELTEVVKGHGDFLGYMTRGGHIIPHKAEQVSG